MLKNQLFKLEYYWHLFLLRYNELLLNDCCSEKLKMKWKIKALYHHSKVLELFSKLHAVVD
ncbi:hypothetical protein ACF5W4_16960 [Bacillota bacterium Lsc_1132]